MKHGDEMKSISSRVKSNNRCLLMWELKIRGSECHSQEHSKCHDALQGSAIVTRIA
jgi:hypothetical protein